MKPADTRAVASNHTYRYGVGPYDICRAVALPLGRYALKMPRKASTPPSAKINRSLLLRVTQRHVNL